MYFIGDIILKFVHQTIPNTKEGIDDFQVHLVFFFFSLKCIFHKIKKKQVERKKT